MMKKILLVEKNQAILEVVSYVLTDAGYDVKALDTEDNIFEEIARYKPHAILLDIILPTVKGTEICNTLKQNERTRHIPVIVLSTHPEVAQIIKQICADDVLSKPFDIPELLETIEFYVNR